MPHLRRHPGDTRFEHFFLKLSAFQETLLAWVREQRHWRPNVLNFTQRYLEDGLKDRAISRDLEWGRTPAGGRLRREAHLRVVRGRHRLPVGVQGVGQASGEPEAWEPFWHGDAKGYYFIGKDNIPFHTIIWPAMLAGYGGLDLPYDVPANEFLNLEGRQLSTSRNWAVWVPDYLDRYDPDPLRYYMSATMPETSDSDFSWRDFVRRNNDELVATYGNLVHRVLTFTYRNFEGRIPQPGELDDGARELLAKAEQAFQAVDDNLYKCHFRAALGQAYVPCAGSKPVPGPQGALEDREAGHGDHCNNPLGNSVGHQLSEDCPQSLPSLQLGQAARNAGFLRLRSRGRMALGLLHSSRFPPGQSMSPPAPLFSKLDEDVAEAELERLGRGTG